jgi:Ulp1 family protease
MRKTCLVGFLKERKLLVSAQENAKLSDRSMSAHFIKMTVNGRFSLENIQEIRVKIDLDKGSITESNLRSSIKEAMKSMIEVKSKEKESSVTSKSETMIGKRKLKKSIQSTKHEESDDDLFTNPLLDDGNQPNKEPNKGEVPVGDTMVGATEVNHLAQRAITFMEKVTKVPITNEEKKVLDDYRAVDMEKMMEEKEKSLFLSKVLVSDTDGGKSDIVKRDNLQTLCPDHWLDDVIISFYLKHCLRKRDEALFDKQKVSKLSHLFNTHFWSKLHNQYNSDLGVRKKYNIGNIKRWSKNVPGKNIFDLERVFVPINVGNLHWVLGVIHIEKMIIELLDSYIGTETTDAIKSYGIGLVQYVKDEYLTIHGSNMDTSKWKFEPRFKGPRQKNNNGEFWRYLQISY